MIVYTCSNHLGTARVLQDEAPDSLAFDGPVVALTVQSLEADGWLTTDLLEAPVGDDELRNEAMALAVKLADPAEMDRRFGTAS